MENIGLALTLLIAGFIIVFVVLILLIVIITLYGKIIQSAQNAASVRKSKKKENVLQPETPKIRTVSRKEIEEYDDEIPQEIIAVIAAAVDAVYGNTPHKIRQIKRSRSVRSAWGNAGLAENTRSFFNA